MFGRKVFNNLQEILPGIRKGLNPATKYLPAQSQQ